VGNIERRLDEAVARRLEADVPLGCFLSGGVDSSLVALLARRHLRELRTFSVRMPDPRYDESRHAERVARHLKTDHATLEVEPDPAGDLVHLVETLGRPLGDSSILPTHWISRAAREHVTVALSGDGGDELFYGYERYHAARLLRRGGGAIGLLPSSIGAGAHPKSRLHKLGRLAGMARASRRFGVLATELLFAPETLDELGAVGPAPDAPAGRDAAAALRAADLTRYLPGDLLAKVDTASMAVALEVRCPFLDRDLAGLVIPTPRSRLMRGGRKGLLRTIARAHLPNSVVDRPKMGFAIPIGEWFRDDYGSMKTLLMDQLSAAEPFGALPVDRGPADRMIREHMDGSRDHGQRLFALLTLSLWATRSA
jgi:asparagine synthase (glutamine-hydrolysing)